MKNSFALFVGLVLFSNSYSYADDHHRTVFSSSTKSQYVCRDPSQDLGFIVEFDESAATVSHSVSHNGSPFPSLQNGIYQRVSASSKPNYNEYKLDNNNVVFLSSLNQFFYEGIDYPPHDAIVPNPLIDIEDFGCWSQEDSDLYWNLNAGSTLTSTNGSIFTIEPKSKFPFGKGLKTPDGTVWSMPFPPNVDWVFSLSIQKPNEPAFNGTATFSKAKKMCESIGAKLPSKEDFQKLNSYFLNQDDYLNIVRRKVLLWTDKNLISYPNNGNDFDPNDGGSEAVVCVSK